MKQNLIEPFQQIFLTDDEPRTFFAPGRINLIGEHTDYNGGYVFPATISYGTYALVRIRSDRICRFYSLNFPDKGVITCHLDDLTYNRKDDWANYVKGMVQYIQDEHGSLPYGIDLLIYGTIPNGAGLSSSASLELVVGCLLNEIFSLNMARLTLIKLGQKVENEYIGVQSGIMDQFAIGMGKRNHAILLDCQTLTYTYAPLNLENYQLIIIHTNKERTLATSDYNDRRTACEQALRDLKKQFPKLQSLCEMTPEQFEIYQSMITNPVNRRRAKHVIYENARTKKAYDDLQKGNIRAFGELMNASHISLRDDFEVSGRELDQIVETAWEQDGVLGARMTGAGFGGCAIALVDQEHATSFIENVGNMYEQRIGYKASFYDVTFTDGVRELKEGVF